MKKENTAIRLKKIMSDRNLRQVDILNMTAPYCKKYDVKMNKSDISQYCSGKTEPNQDKIFVLGIALNVSEAWLMGFDVPMNRTDLSEYEKQDRLIDTYFDTHPDEDINESHKEEFPPEIRAAARGMMDLSPEDQKTAIEMIKFLSQKGKEAKND